MQLNIDTDAAYIVLLESQSTIPCLYHLTNIPHTSDRFFENGTILIERKTLRHSVASAEEAEFGGVFYNSQMTIPIRTLSEAMGHP